MKRLVLLTALLILSGPLFSQSVFLEAEGFRDVGGWTNDNQSMMQMGSPYLISHGLGRPVEDAVTEFEAAAAGDYRLWVRTRDWTRPWGRTESPGRFEVLVNGKAAGAVFGTESGEWAWQDGGLVSLGKGLNRLALHDLTGFDGRCDAIYLTKDLSAPAPALTASFRKKALGLGRPKKAGEYDFVVVGGGIAGICAAITAARLGCKVALVQNRPLLGGNNSSEIRVGLSGLIYKEPYPNLGHLLDEIGGVGHWTAFEARRDPDSPRSRAIQAVLKAHPEKRIHNAGPASNYEDDKKLAAVLAESNITLFLNKQVISAKTRRGWILSVTAKDIVSSEEIVLKGTLFADCTGDGNLGFLSGADWRMGRESKAETGESLAPEVSDMLTMGTSVQWYASEEAAPESFPECPWAIAFSDSTCIPIVRGEWNWETGLGRDQVDDIEHIRDHGLRAVFGNWAYLKNHAPYQEKFANKRLEWVACIGGKRESRRLLGDVILTEQDITDNVAYDDASFTATWGMDLHYPKAEPGLEDEEAFRAVSKTKRHKEYAVPYRCLYSRNIANLLMAGRDISVTHVALGTIRVMRTGGMMGEVIGMAAKVCKDHACDPRAVYAEHLGELIRLMAVGVPVSDGTPKITILGIGDSITQGSNHHVSYLFPLRERLLEAGFDVEMVGPRMQYYRGDSLHHCAIGGKTIEYWTEQIDSVYRCYPADIVLIHGGHNHFVEQEPVAGIVQAHRAIIDKILAINPTAVVFVAQVIESGKLPKYSYIPELNRELEKMVAGYHSDRVRLVPVGKGFDWKTCAIEDHVHPNVHGAEIMAENWYAAIVPLLEGTRL